MRWGSPCGTRGGRVTAVPRRVVRPDALENLPSPGSLGFLGSPESVTRAGAEDDVRAPAASSAVPARSVRVDIRRLDHLLNLVGELSLVRRAMQRLSERARVGVLDPRALRGELHRLHRDLDRSLEGMQRGILEVRMVPLGPVFERLAREVRKLSRELSKEIRLVVRGVETAVDKVIVEELTTPLLHLVRNAMDHGIETAVERVRLGKAPEGTLTLHAYQSGNHVVIEVRDDGAGIDPQAITAAAVRRGIVSDTAAQALGPQDTVNLIFAPGLSTRDRVTETSGRGVGMDVVRTNIARLGGVVDVTSEVGVHTRVTVTLPITLAILAALVVGVAGRRYVLPMAAVAEAVQLAPEAIRWMDGREVIPRDGGILRLCRLGALFGHTGVSSDAVNGAPRWQTGPYVVVLALGGRQAGLVVDELVGPQDVVIKPLGASLRHVRYFAGGTDLGDQRLGLLLDPTALLDEVHGERPGEVWNDPP